jgi:hypothetical protein
MSESQTIAGVGRLFRGQRNLGCVAYRLEMTGSGAGSIVKFDPPPDGGQGDVFTLSLSDGRILECEAAEQGRYFQVRGEGPRAERRVRRRSGLRLLV